MRKVYSYIRFSTPEQAAGHSSQRQADYAARYAADHNMLLDESLTLRDEGLSAYHQSHIKRGALGTFLRAVESGLVPQGSILIVEGLDRLSRAEPIQSQAQLSQIINAGITVVTASDNKTYSRESLKANPMDLVYSLLIMIRAHEESDTKSKRVRQAIHARIQRWIDGKQKGIIRQGRDPGWLRELPDRSGFEPIPEFIAGMRFVVDKYLSGWGAIAITEEMQRQGLSLGGENMERANIYRMIRNPALIGQKRISLDGVDYLLQDYYPAVVSVDVWSRLQGAAGTRKSSGRKGPVPAILTGIKTCYCGYCGQVMVGQTTLSKMRNGVLPDFGRRIMCSAASRNRNCEVLRSMTVAHLEKAVLEYCADSLELSALVNDDESAADVRRQLDVQLGALAEVTRNIDNMTTRFLSMEEVPAAFVRKVNELEAQKVNLEKEVHRLRDQVTALSSSSRPDIVAEWDALRDRARALDVDSRLKVRELIRQTFRRIEVYMDGVGKANRSLKGRLAKQVYGNALQAGDSDQNVDLVLHFRSGLTRMLSIDRKSGSWVAVRDLSRAQGS